MASHVDLIKKIDGVIQNLWAGGVNNPIDYIEQISYFIFLKLLDEKESEREQMARRKKEKYTGVFSGENEKFKFSNWAHSLNGEELKSFVETKVFKFIRELDALKPDEREYFRNAHLKVYEPSTLKNLVESIANIDFSQFDFVDKGDLYEHMLGKISKSGTNGQFRTPRHLIDMMTQMVDPEVMETIYDPACGTAGFLISAYMYLLKKYSQEDTLIKKTNERGEDFFVGRGDLLTKGQRDFLYTKTFFGYDIDINMIRLSIMNMILHGFSEGTNIKIKDILGKNKDEVDLGRTYDIILANPPFSGSIAKERIDKDDFPVMSNSTEVLFLGYIINKLKKGGRCAVIVPEGVIFKENRDYTDIRRYLLEKCNIDAVISLPSGVFQPYSGVKTDILVFTKGKKTEKVWFYNMEKDGYDLGAQRRPIKDSDIPDILEKWQAIKSGNEEKAISSKSWFASIKDIEKQGYKLVGSRYKKVVDEKSYFEMVELGEICNISSGNSAPQNSKLFENGTYPFYRTSDVGKVHLSDNLLYVNDYLNQDGIKGLKLFKKGTILFPKSGASTFLNHRVIMGQDGYVSSHLATISPKDGIISKFLYHLLIGVKAEKLCPNQAYPSLKISDIAKIKIPFPPLEIQEQFIYELDSYQKIIDGAKQIVENYKPVFKIDESWKMIELGEVCELSSGGTPLKSKKEYWDGDIPWYSSGELNEIYTKESKEKITIQGLKNSNSKIFPKGSLLIGMYDTAALKMSVLQNDGAFNQAITGVKPNNKLNLKFLMFFISGQKDEILKLRVGVRQRNLSLGFIKSLKIPFPPIGIQEQIVARIEEEQVIIDGNKKLIEIFERKKQQKIAELFGEDITPKE